MYLSGSFRHSFRLRLEPSIWTFIFSFKIVMSLVNVEDNSFWALLPAVVRGLLAEYPFYSGAILIERFDPYAYCINVLSLMICLGIIHLPLPMLGASVCDASTETIQWSAPGTPVDSIFHSLEAANIGSVA
ncbi:hypothetical protein D9758_012104 [Tetrapyrgos nigripes]|uniref:Uncharacterized protein n=1 Tax=Tetrapyrgos nigripes TaxID=182062 RepID=A0A8H5CMC2_9AGAR|nr:hypothetical protein D9758_012104 [Tetrapyrgos nigripes]